MQLEQLKIVSDFLEAFEAVFDNDWAYTKEMLGIYDVNNTEYHEDIISPHGTFLHPQVEDEVNDWGNRAFLLQNYRKLKESLTDL
jgi:hypothetical protein